MENLSPRQIQILKAIIEEYIETAEAVGSETLDKKYNLGVSPATLRNEMVRLTKMGYLKQSHTSAGRSPTSLAMKLYVSSMMKSENLSVAEEVAVKEKVWDYRFEFDKLLRESTRALAQKTKSLAISTTDKGDIYYAGTANILDIPEFYDIDLTKTVLSLLDQFDYWEKLFEKSGEGEDIHILLGDELGMQYLEPCGFIYTKFKAGKDREGTLGIVGPTRFHYSTVIPTVRYFGDLIEEISRSW